MVKSQAKKTLSPPALEQFLLPLTIVNFDAGAANMYGKIRAILEKQGTLIGSLDTLIAAHALSLQITLISNNVKEVSADVYTPRPTLTLRVQVWGFPLAMLFSG